MINLGSLFHDASCVVMLFPWRPSTSLLFFPVGLRDAIYLAQEAGSAMQCVVTSFPWRPSTSFVVCCHYMRYSLFSASQHLHHQISKERSIIYFCKRREFLASAVLVVSLKNSLLFHCHRHDLSSYFLSHLPFSIPLAYFRREYFLGVFREFIFLDVKSPSVPKGLLSAP